MIGVKRTYLTMSELQFTASAKAVKPAHVDAKFETSWEASKAAINKLSYTENRALVGSSHVMGGMAMGEDLERCVVDSNGKYHYLDNLYVIDGYTHKEIGNLLDISDGTSKWHLSNARKLLREMVNKIKLSENREMWA